MIWNTTKNRGEVVREKRKQQDGLFECLSWPSVDGFAQLPVHRKAAWNKRVFFQPFITTRSKMKEGFAQWIGHRNSLPVMLWRMSFFTYGVRSSYPENFIEKTTKQSEGNPPHQLPCQAWCCSKRHLLQIVRSCWQDVPRSKNGNLVCPNATSAFTPKQERVEFCGLTPCTLIHLFLSRSAYWPCIQLSIRSGSWMLPGLVKRVNV